MDGLRQLLERAGSRGRRRRLPRPRHDRRDQRDRPAPARPHRPDHQRGLPPTCSRSAPRCAPTCTTCGRPSPSRSCRATSAWVFAAGSTPPATRSSRSTTASVRAAAARAARPRRRGDRRHAAVLVPRTPTTSGGWARSSPRSCPAPSISLSSRVVPEFREYVRASTTALNAALLPLMSASTSRRVDRRGRRGRGVPVPLHLMQTNGGVAAADRARELPIALAASGPAAGVIGGARLAELVGERDVLTFDMGGTTADIGLVIGAQPAAAASPARPPACRSTCRRSTCSASAPAAARSRASTTSAR